MQSVLIDLTREWMPHGACVAWQPMLIALILAGEGLTAAAYGRMTVLLWTQWQHHAAAIAASNGVRAVGVYGWFAAFLASCGLGHLLTIVAIWHGYYAAFAAWTLITGILSQIALNRLARAQAASAALWLSPQWRAVTATARALAARLDAEEG